MSPASLAALPRGDVTPWLRCEPTPSPLSASSFCHGFAKPTRPDHEAERGAFNITQTRYRDASERERQPPAALSKLAIWFSRPFVGCGRRTHHGMPDLPSYWAPQRADETSTSRLRTHAATVHWQGVNLQLILPRPQRRLLTQLPPTRPRPFPTYPPTTFPRGWGGRDGCLQPRPLTVTEPGVRPPTGSPGQVSEEGQLITRSLGPRALDRVEAPPRRGQRAARADRHRICRNFVMGGGHPSSRNRQTQRMLTTHGGVVEARDIDVRYR